MSADDGTLSKAKIAAEVLGEVIKAAGDNPEVKAAGGQLGKTALTVTTAINNVLLPIAAVNYGFEKARVYFEKRFAKDIEEKTKDIPPERIVPPSPSIAGPALQGLGFSHEEAPLRDMYLNLLAGAMDADRAKGVHPAFIEVIRQLTADEATVFERVLSSASGIVVERKLQRNHQTIRSYVRFDGTTTYAESRDTSRRLLVDNWLRLGLIGANPLGAAGIGTVDEWAIAPNDESLRLLLNTQPGSFKTFELSHCFTEFGTRFGDAVGIRSHSATNPK